MKKAYEKPEIMFEDFSLSTNIAAGCELVIDNANSGTCGYATEGGIYSFLEDVSGCDFTTVDTVNNGFCYHVPIESNNLFNS